MTKKDTQCVNEGLYRMNAQSDRLIWIACGETANRSKELAKIISWFSRQDSSESWTILSKLLRLGVHPFQTTDER